MKPEIEAAAKALDATNPWRDKGGSSWPEWQEEAEVALAAADAVRFDVEFEERLYRELSLHHPTRGMAVASGVTCECGYWTGREQPGKDRPVGVRGDQLDWHRTQVAVTFMRGEA